MSPEQTNGYDSRIQKPPHNDKDPGDVFLEEKGSSTLKAGPNARAKPPLPRHHPAAVLGLQQTIGNHAVAHLVQNSKPRLQRQALVPADSQTDEVLSDGTPKALARDDASEASAPGNSVLPDGTPKALAMDLGAGTGAPDAGESLQARNDPPPLPDYNQKEFEKYACEQSLRAAFYHQFNLSRGTGPTEYSALTGGKSKGMAGLINSIANNKAVKLYATATSTRKLAPSS